MKAEDRLRRGRSVTPTARPPSTFPLPPRPREPDTEQLHKTTALPQMFTVA